MDRVQVWQSSASNEEPGNHPHGSFPNDWPDVLSFRFGHAWAARTRCMSGSR